MPISSRGSPPAPARADQAGRVYDLTWPDWHVGEHTIGGNASLNGIAKHEVGSRAAWTSTATQVNALHKGRPCVSLTPGAGTGMTSVPSFQLPLERPAEGDYGPAALLARVQFSIAMAATGGDNQLDTGLYFGVRAVGVVNLPSISAYAFGLGRDGADGWKFFATQAGGGALSIDQPLAWPVAQDDWCDGEFRLYPARRDSEARVELWLRGILALSYEWGPGSLLPDYSGVANALGFALAARARSIAASEALLLGGVRFILTTEAEG